MRIDIYDFECDGVYGGKPQQNVFLCTGIIGLHSCYHDGDKF